MEKVQALLSCDTMQVGRRHQRQANENHQQLPISTIRKESEGFMVN